MNTHKPLTIERIEEFIKQGSAPTRDMVSISRGQLKALAEMARASLEPPDYLTRALTREEERSLRLAAEKRGQDAMAIAQNINDNFACWDDPSNPSAVQLVQVIARAIEDARINASLRTSDEIAESQPKPVVSKSELVSAFFEWESTQHPAQIANDATLTVEWAYDFLASRTCVDLPGEEEITAAWKAHYADMDWPTEFDGEDAETLWLDAISSFKSRIKAVSKEEKPEEFFVPAFGFPQWVISNRGRVWSTKLGSFVTANKTPKGYMRLQTIVAGEGTKAIDVHRLMLQSFVGDRPGLQALHLDDVKDNNSLENLVWGTQEENWEHRRINRVTDGGIKYTLDQVKDVKRRGISGQKARQISEETGVNLTAVKRILRGENWSHVEV